MKVLIAQGEKLARLRTKAFEEAKAQRQADAERYGRRHDCGTMTALGKVEGITERQRRIEKSWGLREAKMVPIGEALKTLAVSQLIGQLKGVAETRHAAEERERREMEELEELMELEEFEEQHGFLPGAFG